MLHSPANNCVAHWYKRKLGTMMGIVTGAAAVGSIVDTKATVQVWETSPLDEHGVGPVRLFKNPFV